MKKRNLLLATLLFIITAANSFAQTNYTNWVPFESKDGIELQFRTSYYESIDGQINTELQIKAINTRHKEVMVNLEKINFPNGFTDSGSTLLFANQNSYTFTFRNKGKVNKFTADWTVEYNE